MTLRSWFKKKPWIKSNGEYNTYIGCYSYPNTSIILIAYKYIIWLWHSLSSIYILCTVKNQRRSWFDWFCYLQETTHMNLVTNTFFYSVTWFHWYSHRECMYSIAGKDDNGYNRLLCCYLSIIYTMFICIYYNICVTETHPGFYTLHSAWIDCSYGHFIFRDSEYIISASDLHWLVIDIVFVLIWLFPSKGKQVLAWSLQCWLRSIPNNCCRWCRTHYMADFIVEVYPSEPAAKNICHIVDEIQFSLQYIGSSNIVNLIMQFKTQLLSMRWWVLLITLLRTTCVSSTCSM